MDEDLELFYEDASEQLQFMENALLDAKEGTKDSNKIGEIFRAMHTIKGTAGMFDFTDIVSFTHVAESLLDEVRSGTVDLDGKMATLFMQVKDTTANMVEASINGIPYSSVIITQIENLKKQLVDKMPHNKNNTQDIQSDIKEEDISTMVENDLAHLDTTMSDENLWHISIRFDEDFFTSGMDVLSIFKFFNKMGEILLNIPIIAAIPLLDELDPLKTYIGFEVLFQSSCSYDEIVEVFEFVEDDVTLYIFKQNENQKYEELLKIYPNLEEILANEGIYEKETEKKEVLTEKKGEIADEPPLRDIEEIHNIQTQKIEEVEEESIPRMQKSSSTLRVDSYKIDLLINKMGEMVIQNSKLLQMAEDRMDEDIEELATTMNELLEQVRDGVMDMRMVQVKDSFIKFKRIVNDTAKSIGKDIDFIIEGEETELDKSVVEKLSDPLVHMLRNSIDHGVEMPSVRIANGKNPKGRVVLRAYPDSGTTVIEIEDDGGGINKEAVLKKAIENNIVKATDNLTNKEIYKLIFSAGLSTAKEISAISGRGVGMDVVKRNIEDLRGIIDVDSVSGKGSKITIRLPLTLAVIDGFLIQAGNTKYIIPLNDIVECIELTSEYKSKIKGSQTIHVRDEILPLLDIRKTFKEEIFSDIRENVVIVKYANYKVGLQVDELYGEQQTVIKPLGDMFQNVKELSGGAILGTGEVALIFDIAKLIENQIKKGE
ncbi:MAG: chemotaxis protein CheA [Arcobacteraceae bacterium]|nr:chemotaxis protein CheA [Arcobacteraceae bacterium]